MMKYYLNIFLLFFISTQCFANNSTDFILGEYYTYCECGSNTTLVIKKNAIALLSINIEGKIINQKAKWQFKDDKLTINYNGITDTFVFDGKISTINSNLSFFYGYTKGLLLIKTSDLPNSIIKAYGGNVLFAKNGDINKLTKKLKEEAMDGMKDIDKLLISSIEKCDLKGMEETIAKGANINIPDKNGTTPIMYAVQTVFPKKKDKACAMKIVQTLIKSGAKINEEDNPHGKTGSNHVINIAAFYSSIEMVKLLIDNGADINSKNSDGTNILFDFLGQSGSQDIQRFEFIKYLVAKGIDISLKTRFEDNSALILLLRHYSEYPGFLDFAKILIKKGADLKHKNIYGETAFSIAQKKGINTLIFTISDAK